MREPEFRRRLAERLGAGSVDSYIAYCRRVERELDVDLDLIDLSPAGIANLEPALRSRGVAERSIGNCMSAVRSYAVHIGENPSGLQRPVMTITREQREAWAERTAGGPFNRWLDKQVRDQDGRLDLKRLHVLARRFGIDKEGEYAHLNPGQQRMNIGNLLRRAVPRTEYEHAGSTTVEKASAKVSPASAPEVIPEVPGTIETPPVPESIRAAGVRELLLLYSQVMEELRAREVVRTSNSPVGDYGELLFAKAFGWCLEANSAAGHDATDVQGIRYQIKARRLTKANGSRQLSAIRKLNDDTFDCLAAVLFDANFKVLRAIIIPHALVANRARRREHTNSWLFMLDDRVWLAPGVRDVTAELAVAAATL